MLMTSPVKVRIFGEMRCEEWLDVSRLLYDITRGTSADNVDVISFGLVFEDNSLRNVFRIAAEKINLQVRVFFLEGLLERSHDLIDRLITPESCCSGSATVNGSRASLSRRRDA